ncbi:hypothetical protein I3842_15G134700 [Carya illinoinensis]|uniref:AB hydrolase-1 domain-containing protein n=1 Tax=Carya illinoinensis TaxID=32201 RepID=A0A922D8T1_CARIL|nr:hypothetical protein I3842_15G134700 [Carya illinoinensis]
MGIVEEAHNVRVLGRGEKIVVLGHGFGTGQSVWKHLVPHLVDEYRITFDFERYSTLEGFAYDLLAILEEVQVDSCIFVGHSFSAMIGSIASTIHPNLFSKILMLSPNPRMLNDVDYHGGFEREDLDQIFKGVLSNYEAWYMDLVAVQEFCKTLFNMRPDIALSLARTIFLDDTRHVLGLVTMPCHIIQSIRDLSVPIAVSKYLHRNLGTKSILSSPEVLIPVLLKHIRYGISELTV